MNVHRSSADITISPLCCSVASLREFDEDHPVGDFSSTELELNQTAFDNNTNFGQLACIYKYESELLTNFSGCYPINDKVLCWPPTAFNTYAALPCSEIDLFGIDDNSENATKFCNEDGSWGKSIYDMCINTSMPMPSPDTDYNTMIYCIGYSISIITLTLAVIVFLYFKELRCLRNTIHCNLFITYIFSALLWLMNLSFQTSTTGGLGECIVLLTLFHYFNLTNFFWMMVEGLYLYLLVVETFSRIDIINKFAVYAVIGYGVPGICAFCWTIVKGIVSHSESAFHEFQFECPWMQESSVDWIFKGPACAVLIINLVFLFTIMWVLITKLRSANTAETRQYRKAAKALLVLIPLFGLTYLIVLYGPNEGIGKKIFDIARAFLLSTQGFFVALFYCFLNSEVRKAIKSRIHRWRDARNIRTNQLRQQHNSRRFTKNGKNRSPQSLRPLTYIQKRESNVTTTTLISEVPISNYPAYRGSNGALHMPANPRAISPLMRGLDENSV